MRLSPREIEDLLSEDLEDIEVFDDPAEDDDDAAEYAEYTSKKPAPAEAHPIVAAYAEQDYEDYGDFEYWRDRFKPAVGDDYY